MKKKNVAKKIAAVSAAAALAVTGVMPASAAYINSERKSLKEFADLYGEEWDKEREAYLGEKAGSINITLEMGETARALIGSFTEMGLDFSWLESIGLEVAGSAAEEDVFDMAIGLLLNDTVLASAEMPINFENNSVAFCVPQISRDYIDIPFEFEDMESLRQWEHLKDVMDPDFLAELMPDGGELADMLNRYGSILLNNMTEEGSYEETVNVCGVEQSFTVYEGRLSQEGLFRTMENMLVEARDDEQLKTLVENLGEFSSEPLLYKEFRKNVDEQISELRDILKEAENGEDGDYISSKIWVDEKGENAGREIAFYGDGGRVSGISWLSTEKDGRAGFRLCCDEDGSMPFVLSGSGVITDGKLSGDYMINADGEAVLAIEVTDYDVNLEKGDIDGTYKLTYVADAGDVIYNTFSLLVDVEEKTAEKTSSLGLSLLMGDEVFAALKFRTNTGTALLDGKEMDGILYRADDQEDMQAYISGIDVTTIMENCKKAGVPDDFIDQVTSLVMGLMTESSMYE